MFDALVQDLASRFDLGGGKAGTLVRVVLTYLFQEESGGLNGFLDRFRKAGLGDLVSSWMGNSAPRELTPGQLEGVVGRSFLEQLADKAGLSASKATPALAALLPLYGTLDPDQTGGAMLLGVDGVCIISHGSSSATAIVNATRVAGEMVEAGVVDRLRSAVASA